MSRNRLYWTLQISMWTIYGLIGATISFYVKELTATMAVFYAFAAALMLFTSHFLRLFVKRQKWLNLRLFDLIIRVVPTLIVLSLITNVFTTLYGFLFTDLLDGKSFKIGIYFFYSFQTFTYLSLWFGIYLMIYYFRNYKQEEIEKWRLQSAVKDAELIALKAQINPHFLFNALNNIRALILEDHMKARDMVSHLSELLRYSIQFNSNEKVTVWEELDIVEKYLELETIHYENRLKFEIEADRKLKKFKIPPMIIQLMAENAVKHGISQVKGGGEINVAVKSEKEDLILEVSNTGKLKEKPLDGIGLRNAMERIRILFEKEPELALFQEVDMVRSVLKLPIQE